MTTAVRGPLHPLTLPGEKTDVAESGLPNGNSLDTPRVSERSASMDATESGSDSEQQLASLASPQNGAVSSSSGAAIASSSETSTTAASTPSTGPQPSQDQQQLFLAMQQQQGRQTGGYQGPPRPPRRALFPSQQLGPQGEEQKLPIRPEAEECLFYIHTGWCGYGASCRYNHPPEKMALHKPKAYNSLGLPLREGVQNCPYFMRMITCKFAGTCKFNHPQHVIDEAARQQQQNPAGAAVGSMQQQQQQQPQQQQMYMQHQMMYSPGTSPTHLRQRFNSSGSVPTSPVLGPVSAGGVPAASFAMPATSPTAYGQPVFVYYVQQPPAQQEACLSFMTTGRCQMGYQCPYAHHQ